MLDEIEKDISTHEKFVVEQLHSIKDGLETFNTQTAFKNVVETALQLTSGHNSLQDDYEYYHHQDNDENEKVPGETAGLLQRGEKNVSFNPLCGTIQKDEQVKFKKMIFRASRGMAYTSFYDLKENTYDYYGNVQNTTVYFVVYPSDLKSLTDKLTRVADSFMGNRFELPSDNLAGRLM